MRRRHIVPLTTPAWSDPLARRDSGPTSRRPGNLGFYIFLTTCFLLSLVASCEGKQGRTRREVGLILRAWESELSLAEATPRMQLAPRIAHMQELQERLLAVDSPANSPQRALGAWMALVIQQYTMFLANQMNDGQARYSQELVDIPKDMFYKMWEAESNKR